ncbi:hypothetical protein [Agrococcus casei]|uniref:Integral membrane protein n=1 Tax=Agrococcus casei LMG 22410 TaxID=1255656 RepID=A0A1R4G9G6_9MICO|nr:hypothetical protein [Agrococcus casei]SJM64725.1 hypothetical protein CZ674_10025 [Agrococcus casei LMG 22410]
MEILRLVLLAAHFIGLALLVGTFLSNLRRNENWNMLAMVIGAAIQLLSGIGLYGMTMALGGDPNHMKLGIKGIVALLALVGAVIGLIQQRKLAAAGENQRPAKKFFHMAGGFATINVLLAVFWH